MYSEYSVAYSYTTREDIEAFIKDFKPYLEGLIENDKFEYALSQIPDFLFELLEVSELRNKRFLPKNWKDILIEMISKLESKELTYFDIDKQYASSGNGSSYEASYLQALYLLIAYYNNTKDQSYKLRLNPNKYSKFVSGVLGKKTS